MSAQAPVLERAEAPVTIRLGRGEAFAPEPRARRHRRVPRPGEGLVVFCLGFAAYMTLGYLVTVRGHLVPGDGWSRLAHAYFTFYADPPKLAAIGFEWPPLDTLVLLPLAVIKPLATSLIALPLSTAVFAGGMLAVLNRTLTMCELPRPARWLWLAAFAVNPMIAYYSVNGMSEVPYLFCLTVTVHLFLRWALTRNDSLLILLGLMLAIDFLARFELLAWSPLLIAGIWVVLAGQRAHGMRIEGTLLATAAPIVFGFGVWCMFNAFILGDPLYWLKIQTEANLSSAGNAAAPHTLGAIVHSVISINWRVFALTPVIAGALAAVAVLRRDAVSLILSAAVAMNAVMTVALLVNRPSTDLLRLRYNMRAMPLAVIGAGWLFYRFRGRLARGAIWLSTLALIALSIPLAAQIMREGKLTYYEDAFVRWVQTGHDQEGSDANLRLGRGIGVAPEREMAAYITRHTAHRPHYVLADDSQTYGVLLFTGHPEWFINRIDHGDTSFNADLSHPYRFIRTPVGGFFMRGYEYYLVSPLPVVFNTDKILDRYPGADRGRVPWLRPVYSSRLFVLLAVAPPSAVAPALLRRLAGLAPPRAARPA